jgi:hypothetical protein
MNFSIRFSEEEFQELQGNYALGEMRLGDFCESFQASLSYWAAPEYLLQWKEGLQRTCTGSTKSCLITSMYDPACANYLFWWTLYLDGFFVHVHNQILFLENVDRTTFESKIYEYISDRETLDEDGNRISEWTISLDDVKKYLALLESSNSKHGVG